MSTHPTNSGLSSRAKGVPLFDNSGIPRPSIDSVGVGVGVGVVESLSFAASVGIKLRPCRVGERPASNQWLCDLDMIAVQCMARVDGHDLEVLRYGCA